VADVGQAGKPDITFVRNGTAHVWEIKPFTMESVGLTEVNWYVKKLNDGGLPAFKGSPSIIGVESVSAPGGVFVYWGSQPGVVLYAYFKTAGKGENTYLTPARAKAREMQWKKFARALPSSKMLEDIKFKSQVVHSLRCIIEGAVMARSFRRMGQGMPRFGP
jgi:hypothetical protein